MATKFSDPALKNIPKVAKEAEGRYLSDQAQRGRATNILRPEEVAGQYDADRLLQTTLGGIQRALTLEDLVQFKAAADKLGKKYHGGITARAVVNRSRPVDRERANAEIRVAVPYQTSGNKVHFITNAGPKSEVTRHHVLVEFLAIDAATAAPSTARDAAKLATAGAIKFDCDCGRHRYWYRYVATIGRFNAGRIETGFPKIRNPNLTGVACKHVLRTMQVLGTPMIRAHVEKMIERARGSFDKKLVKITAADARKLAELQMSKRDQKNYLIESGGEKAKRLIKVQGDAFKRLLQRSSAKAVKPAPTNKRKVMELRRAAVQGGMSAKLFDKLLAALSK